MFSCKLGQKSKAIIQVKLGDRSIEYPISVLINSRNNDKILFNPYQFKILNDFINWKGDDFKEVLFNTLEDVNYKINRSIMTKRLISSPPIDIITTLTSLFNISECEYFVMEVARIKPATPKAEFEEQIEIDGMGSRDQTYTHSDYLELCALLIIIKAILGPLCLYGELAYGDSSDRQLLDYKLFHFILNDSIYDTNQMKKMIRYVDKIILNNPSFTDDQLSRKTLELGLPKDEMGVYLLATTILEKLSIATIYDDNQDKNLATIMYNSINIKMKTSTDVSSAIIEKSQIQDSDNSGDKESIVESSRIITDISDGIEVELNYFNRDIDSVISQLDNNIKKYIDMKAVKDCESFIKPLLDNMIDKNQITLLKVLFKLNPHPNAIDYLNRDSIKSLYCVGFGLLWGLGFYSLALFLTSIKREENGSTSIALNRSRIRPDQKEELLKFYPFSCKINKNTEVNPVEEWINDYANILFSYNYIPLAYKEYQDLGISNGVMIDINIKITLCDLLIKLERILNGVGID